MLKMALIAMSLSLSAASFASTAGCDGKINGKNMSFRAQGSLSNMDSGKGQVKVNGKEVANFDGEALSLSKFRRTFYIENARGDVVQGKLNNIFSGAATLVRLSLPGEGIEVRNVPVSCWIKF